MRKNIIVSNRLPVNVTKLENSFLFQSSSGGLATGLKSIHQKSDSLWIGWSGISSSELSTPVSYTHLTLPTIYSV